MSETKNKIIDCPLHLNSILEIKQKNIVKKFYIRL